MQCAGEADVVIVPSLYMHGIKVRLSPWHSWPLDLAIQQRRVSLTFRKTSTQFKSVNPWDETNGKALSDVSDIDREKRHKAFWDKIRKAYQRGNTTEAEAHWPLIVVHYSYVFDAGWSIGNAGISMHIACRVVGDLTLFFLGGVAVCVRAAA